jgi:hypothetical protein
MPPPSRASRAPAAPSNASRALVGLLFIAALIGVPASVMLGSAWFEMPRAVPGDKRPLPQWVSPGELRTSTRDGTLVKLRVALDAGSSSNKSAVEQNLREVTQVLQVSVGARHTRDLLGTSGVQRLAGDMLAAANGYLEAKGLARLNGVAIQDLWYARP